ncbi:3-oxoacyl-ACP reductase family protein [Pseudomonas sp. RC3H12]|uniref:3-oxoacyl-ACP reductase family protein n=1 Tax=Pseudomonas sp. RC3H12 TaxID=2834406 RepID=UPI001BDEE81A|nr:3-oxoacyl-ACP reductase family protein [Pseudomonas sp. RC3H12]QWA30524.1 3-oxoacyl-ACP reductase FabG [Pseudomonas sp. RC3H12]
MSDITNKVALVTGGSRGIGREIAVALAKAGCDIAISYANAESDAAETVLAVQEAGRNALAVQGDLTQPGEAERIAQTVAEQLGEIDILVNNAGITKVQPLDGISMDDWNLVLHTNLTSAFSLSQAVIPKMREKRWGRIIMMSSVAAQLGGVIGPHYAASKAGMIGLAHSYAQMLAKEGITANAVAPALIKTDMIKGNPNIKPDLLPVGRFGEVAEVANAVVLLAQNGYITGQTLNVNGGWYMS